MQQQTTFLHISHVKSCDKCDAITAAGITQPSFFLFFPSRNEATLTSFQLPCQRMQRKHTQSLCDKIFNLRNDKTKKNVCLIYGCSYNILYRYYLYVKLVLKNHVWILITLLQHKLQVPIYAAASQFVSKQNIYVTLEQAAL